MSARTSRTQPQAGRAARDGPCVGAGPADAECSRYSRVAIALHWTIATLILLNGVLGWRMGPLHGPLRNEIFQLHKSIGVTVLALSLLRLGWRRLNPPPPYPASIGRLERAAAAAVHALLYAFMIVVPLTGWIMVSSSPKDRPNIFFWMTPLPNFPVVHGLPLASRAAIEHVSDAAHIWLAWSALALAALHAAAAIRHQLWDRTPILARMLPGPGRGGS